MKLIHLDNIEDPALKIYGQLRENAFNEDNSFIADSPKVVNLLLRSNIKINSILATQEYYDAYESSIVEKKIETLYVAPKKELEKIVGHTVHHNCMAHGIRPNAHALDALGDKVLMLDSITSTQNIGAIARSMAGLGVDSYVVSNLSPHPYARRALRVSMGYISHLKYHVYTDTITACENLKQLGYKIYAAELTEGATLLNDVEISGKWVLIMGHEGKGISQDILDVCDEVVSIEMQDGVKSFNVGVAASLIMYKFLHT